MKGLTVLFLCLLSLNLTAQETENGKVRQTLHDKLQAWDQATQTWLSLELFWLNFAQNNDEKFWGQTTSYPNYDDVNEFDTVLIQLKQGACLMQFFHGRWRRANDVQRWDETFNGYSGCPFVFD